MNKKLELFILVGLVFSAYYFLISYKMERNKLEIKTSIEDYYNCELEKQIEAITAKKNTLYLIALERGKKRPNKAYLDSLEIDYELR